MDARRARGSRKLQPDLCITIDLHLEGSYMCRSLRWRTVDGLNLDYMPPLAPAHSNNSSEDMYGSDFRRVYADA